MARWHRFGAAVGLTALVGCGSPSPDAPQSGHATGSAEAGVSALADQQAQAGQDSTSTPLAGPSIRYAATPGVPITNAPRTSDATRVPLTAPPTNPQPFDDKTPVDHAQREARQQWFIEMREHPDVTARLQALEFWAQQPNDGLNPVTYGLVDEDESVRARAQELYAQQLQREPAATRPVQEEHREQNTH